MFKKKKSNVIYLDTIGGFSTEEPGGSAIHRRCARTAPDSPAVLHIHRFKTRRSVLKYIKALLGF